MRPWRRRGTLVELVQRDIIRSDDLLGPDWREVVSDAVYRQDMEWVEDEERQRQWSSFIRSPAASM